MRQEALSKAVGKYLDVLATFPVSHSTLTSLHSLLNSLLRFQNCILHMPPFGPGAVHAAPTVFFISVRVDSLMPNKMEGSGSVMDFLQWDKLASLLILLRVTQGP